MNLDEQLRDLLARGEKIEAIKLYREATGAGLAEAKQYVERLEAGQAAGGPPPGLDDAFWQSLVELLKQGQKIEAIKRYRERTGAGLKESKEAVESLTRQSGLPVGSGCGSAAATLLLLAGALAWAALR